MVTRWLSTHFLGAPASARAAEWMLLSIAALSALEFTMALLSVVAGRPDVIPAFAFVLVLVVGVPVLCSRLVARGSRLSIPIAVVTLAWAVASTFYGVDVTRLMQLELAIALLVTTFLPEFRGYVRSRRTAERPVRLRVERRLE